MADRYVRAAGGSDGNDGSTFALGWATLQYAFDNIAAGDTLYICGDFTISAQVDLDTTSGTYAAPIYVRGADSSGTPHAGAAQTTITTTTDALNALIAMGSTDRPYYWWFDLKFDGGGSGKATYCWAATTSSTGNRQRWHNCRFTNADGDGYYSGANAVSVFVDCEFDSNGADGSGSGYTSANTRGHGHFINCDFHDNADDGAFLNVSPFIAEACRFYDNGGDGLRIGGAPATMFFINRCVFFENTSDGLSFLSTAEADTIMNCVFASNHAYGVSSSTRDADSFTTSWRNNWFYNNTSGDCDWNSGTFPGVGNTTATDPKFTSTTDGSEDFTPQSDSGLIDAGYPSGDIGAVQAVVTGGSGSGVDLPEAMYVGI